MAAARKGRRAGRRVPKTPKDRTRDAILDVAEELFSQSGYASTSFRDIASIAAVNPALISYYFKTKRLLFEAVYQRRGKQLTDRWATLLIELDSRPSGHATVEELLRAFLEPQFEMKRSRGGMAFIRLQTQLHSESDEHAFALRRKVYDDVARQFLAALQRILPQLERSDVSWRFVSVIAVGLFMSADVDRLVNLSNGRFDSTDLDEAVERIISFCLGGMCAVSISNPHSAAPGKRASGLAEQKLDVK